MAYVSEQNYVDIECAILDKNYARIAYNTFRVENRNNLQVLSN